MFIYATSIDCEAILAEMALFVSSLHVKTGQWHYKAIANQQCSLTPEFRLHKRCTFTAATHRARWQMNIDPHSEKATVNIQAAVKELRGRLKKCTLYFVGPMGSGKSVVAKYLAHQLGFRFLDTDELIELFAKKDISAIFESEGENSFRELETAVLDQVQAFVGVCVSTGGGIVMRQANWGKLQTGIVVFLDVPVDVLVKRLEGDKTRPLLQGTESLRNRIESILEKRRSMYEQADVVVNVKAEEAIDNVSAEVVRKLNNFIKENPPRLAKLYTTISHQAESDTK